MCTAVIHIHSLIQRSRINLHQKRNNLFLLRLTRIDWLPQLTEEPKSADYEQRISDVARSERNGFLIILIGVFLVNAGLVFDAIGRTSLALVGSLFFIALGAFSTLFGFYISVHYGRKYNDLLKE